VAPVRRPPYRLYEAACGVRVIRWEDFPRGMARRGRQNNAFFARATASGAAALQFQGFRQAAGEMVRQGAGSG